MPAAQAASQLPRSRYSRAPNLVTADRQQFKHPRPGALFGSYRLLREIGEGSSSIVFLATREQAAATPQTRHVAVKLLRPQHHSDPAAVARFLRTAQLAQRVAGANLCPIEQVGSHDGVPYVVMQFLDGATIADEIRGRAHDPTDDPRGRIERLLQQFEKVAQALHHLHARGITHRDIKPSNVLVDGHGEPWLLDFGLWLERAQDSTIRLAGSLAYLAPELLCGGGAPGVATDLYALGVTLFEAITGRLPFRSHTASDLLAEILAGHRATCRRFERAVPTDLDVVVDRLLQQRPADRYPDAAAVAEDLRRVRTRLPLALRGTRRLTRFVRWLRRNPVPTASLLALAVTAPALLWLLQDYRRSLHLTELLAAPTLLVAAEREAALLLPAQPTALPAIRHWLTTYDGPGGLRELRSRLADELAARQTTLASPAAATNPELATELRTVEQMPHWIEALSRQSRVTTAFPALLPAIERHRHALEARLEAPAADALDHEPSGVTQMLRELLASLDAATGAGGVVERMRREQRSLELEQDAIERHATAWRAITAAVATSPHYAADIAAGFRLHARQDLVPIGTDPDSGLAEFALQRSGTVPRRDADGRLPCAAEHAVVFVLLPGGTFTMGATNRPGMQNHDVHAWPEEGPTAPVTLAPFLLAKHELTQAQWRRLGGAQTAILQAGDRLDGLVVTDLHPAEGMSFADAETVLHRHGLALPSEAQWEYAARRGGFCMPFAGVANLRGGADGFASTHAPVGRHPADRSGLHDLHGNVAEMVADHFANYDLGVPRPGDGLRLAWRAERISRGGSFQTAPEEARASCRSLLPDFGLLPFVGLRPVLPIAGP